MEQAPDFLHIRISGHPAYVSRVLEASHDGFLVCCPVDGATSVVPAAGTPVDVGRMTSAGMVAWSPGVATGAETRGEAWAFRLRMLDGAVAVERRSHPRAQVAFAAEIVPAVGAVPLHATVLDIGAGGVRVRVAAPPAVDDVVQLVIFPPEEEPVRLSARVIRVEGDTVAFGYELFWSGSVERLVEIAFQHAADGHTTPSS